MKRSGWIHACGLCKHSILCVMHTPTSNPVRGGDVACDLAEYQITSCMHAIPCRIPGKSISFSVQSLSTCAQSQSTCAPKLMDSCIFCWSKSYARFAGLGLSKNHARSHEHMSISGGVQSDFLPNTVESMHCTHATRLPPGDLQKQWKILAFLHAPPKGRPDHYRQNLTIIEIPL